MKKLALIALPLVALIAIVAVIFRHLDNEK
jgi:hypothetical protein